MLKRSLQTIHTVWSIIWLIVIFLCLFPFIFLCIIIKPFNRYGTWLCNLWADLFFPISFMPVTIERETVLDPQASYIFVANHFSYLDVAIGMKVVRNYFSYMGKASVKKIPLLGFMFAKLHIQVNRSDKNSRSKAIMRSKRALESGRSLFIMPEGGIVSEEIPKMKQPFKDGAFSMAIEAKVPIVPITLVNLHKIMPATKILWGIPKVVVHAPVATDGKNVEDLKLEVYNIIQNTIDKHENRN
jgi:1-acyl-sn-glycerol-3-phosphate acyltransferase